MSKIPKIYLAGGFKSGWQDRIISAISPDAATLIDPRIHGIENPDDYTKWDLQSIRESDILFACMEPSNPGGYALALELGYAKALNKKIVFVDEVYQKEPKKSKYLDMLRSSADYSCYSLNEGISILTRIL